MTEKRLRFSDGVSLKRKTGHCYGNRQAHHRGALQFPQHLGEGLPWLLLDQCFVTDGSMLLPLKVSDRLAP